ncbi:choice-of-anchor A family protein [Enterovibrio calviensis]|uniref:choice-of-anchor A family protein n=1 Tax=Enterovibrio calviensis TaxID=91359 RepID=UPI00054CE0F2|nr:choice-of-anchor A family protein [Enterovibrio calviensis]
MKKIFIASALLLSTHSNALTTQYGALVFGDFTSPHSTSIGPLAIGQNASFNGYSILYDNTNFPSDEYSLIIGGDLSYKSGRIYQGSAIVKGNISQVSETIYLGLAEGATLASSSVLPIDFDLLKQDSVKYSSILSEQESVGTVNYQWGGLYLEGDCTSPTQVFNLDGYQLEDAHTLALNCIPEDATLIVNISGDKPNFKPLSNISLSDFTNHRQRTIFNIYEATSLSISGVALEGFVLAPNADVNAPSGNSNVGIIANSWQGSMSLGYLPFEGNLPIETGPAPIQADVKWHWQESNFMPEYVQVMGTPIVGQLNDDNGDGSIDSADVADVIVVTFANNQYTKPGVVRALSGIDGAELWDYSDGPVYSDPRFTPALADLDADGLIDIVVADNATNEVRIINNEGIVKRAFSREDKYVGNVSISDLDSDGVAEILVGTSAYSYSSGLLYNLGLWRPDYVIFDADGDQNQDYFGGGTLYDASGNIVWSYSGWTTAWFSSVANLDEDPQPEIVVTIAGTTPTSHTIAALNHDGTVIWEKVGVPGNGGGAQTIGVFLEDDKLGIAYAAFDKLIMLNASGEQIWSVDIFDKSGKMGVTSFDFDGDGRDEVIYQDHHKVEVLDSLTGKSLLSVENSTDTLWEYPIVVDLEGDNNAELIIVANNYSSEWNSHNGVRVFGSASEQKPWKHATRIWNQHSYHQTNISQSGEVPKYEQASWLLNNSYRSSTMK